jgi:hypothetical protein
MRVKLSYTEAVKLLTAFLGSDISVEKCNEYGRRTCRVTRLKPTERFEVTSRLILERGSWESILDEILPAETFPDWSKRDYHEIGTAARLYQFRHIGKTK